MDCGQLIRTRSVNCTLEAAGSLHNWAQGVPTSEQRASLFLVLKPAEEVKPLRNCGRAFERERLTKPAIHLATAKLSVRQLQMKLSKRTASDAL